MNSTEDKKRILIIDDTREIVNLLGKYLIKNGYNVESAMGGREGIELVQQFNPHVIFLDIHMPGMSGVEVQAELNRLGINTPVIIITGYSSMQTAVLTIRSGAYDYITKPFDLDRILIVLRRCFEDFALKDSIRSGLDSSAEIHKFELIGSSRVMIGVYKTIASVSTADPRVSVLISGETGTGKELVARQIHQWGKSAKSPFVALNVTALPDTLIESELFGHEKGSFTGATQRRLGKLELAGDGTLLLDEIGDISLHLQHKLLRVLQEREFYRLGGSEAISLKARVVAATNRDLSQSISQGLFREDLYYRLNVISVTVPPLRERSEDIPALVRYFVNKYSDATEKQVPLFSEEALLHLSAHSWPGNVRELENVVLRALTSINSPTIMPGDIPLGIPVALDTVSIDNVTIEEGRKQVIEQFERQYIIDSLNRAEGRVSQAADRTGMNRESFYRLMRKYKIKPNQR